MVTTKKYFLNEKDVNNLYDDIINEKLAGKDLEKHIDFYVESKIFRTADIYNFNRVCYNIEKIIENNILNDIKYELNKEFIDDVINYLFNIIRDNHRSEIFYDNLTKEEFHKKLLEEAIKINQKIDVSWAYEL